MKRKRIYALYKGEVNVMDGTLEDIAKYLGIKKKSVAFYASPVHQKRSKNGYAVVFVGVEFVCMGQEQ